MTEFQTHIFKMMEWLHSFIVEKGLTYYICDGTMLGAARHKGFIPWDDDIDIMMPRPDYETLCDYLKKPIDGYVVETIKSDDKNFLYTTAKFYDTRTTMTELLRKKITRGVCIDIFPLDGLCDDIKLAKKRFKKIDRLNMFLMTRICEYRKGRKWYKNLIIFISRLIPNFLINSKKIAIKLDLMNKSIDYNKSKIVMMSASTYREKEIYYKKILGRPTLYKFESTFFYGPERYNDYLTQIYGEWTVLPPEQKRHTAHDFVDLDFNKSYLDKKNTK